MVDDVIRLPPVPLVVMPAGAPSEKEHMDTKLLKCLVFSATTVLKNRSPAHKQSLFQREGNLFYEFNSLAVLLLMDFCLL